jgi:hypothetical protein
MPLLLPRLPGCVNSISAFSPRESSKSEDTVCPGGHAGVSSGLTVEVRTDREWGTARASSVSVRLHVGKHASGEIARTAAALSRPRGSARRQGEWLPRAHGSRTLRLHVVRESRRYAICSYRGTGPQSQLRTILVRITRGVNTAESRRPRRRVTPARKDTSGCERTPSPRTAALGEQAGGDDEEHAGRAGGQ